MVAIFEKIATAYKYVFYKLYRWSGEVNIRREPDEVQAIIMLSLSIAMYFLAFEAFLQLLSISPRRVSNDPETEGAIFSVIFCTVLFLINFHILKFKVGFENIIREFSLEDTHRNKMGNILVTFYVIGSFVLPVTLWIIIGLLNA